MCTTGRKKILLVEIEPVGNALKEPLAHEIVCNINSAGKSSFVALQMYNCLTKASADNIPILKSI